MMSHAVNFPLGEISVLLTKERGLVFFRSGILGVASSLNTITEMRQPRNREALSSYRCIILPDKAQASSVEKGG